MFDLLESSGLLTSVLGAGVGKAGVGGGERVRVSGDGGWAGRVEGGRNQYFVAGVGIGPAVAASGPGNRRRKGENRYFVSVDR